MDFRADGGSASARDQAAAVGDAAIPLHLPGNLSHVKLCKIQNYLSVLQSININHYSAKMLK